MRALLVGLLALALGTALIAQSVPADKSVDVSRINKKIEPFTLTDSAGKKHALADLAGKKATVVVFLSFECPNSNSYSPTLAELHKAYAGKGVTFLGINASDELTQAQVEEKAKEFALPFPVLKDPHRKVADLFKARVVPEAFLLDHNLVLRYRGRIDNTFAARLCRNPITTSHDLKRGLDELLAGKDVGTPATRAIGCFIPYDRGEKAVGKVTYHKDVLPILQKHCQTCHRQGEVGPFSLMTYRQAVNWASDIKEYTRDRRMPPWKPVEGVAFRGDRRLTQNEIDILAAWADSGTPEGNRKDAPPPAKFADGWQLGTPDLVLTVADEFTLGPSGKDVFRCFVLPTGLKEDRHVIAYEVRPGNKRVVHHTLNFFDGTGRARALEKKEKERVKKPGEQDHGPGYSVSMGLGFLPTPGKFGGLGGWAPGQVGYFLPDGYGYALPAGSDIVLQTHYHRNGRQEKDKTSIGLYFAKGKGTKPFKPAVLPGRFLVIPSGVERFRVTGTIETLEDCKLYSVMPHMHMLGREIKVTMKKPGQDKAEVLLAIKDWDYNWQETYFLKAPMDVAKGTKLSVEAIYDNSAKNPNNPFNPPRWVTFGEQTDNEMCFVFFGVTTDDASSRPLRVRFEGITLPRPKKD